MSIRAIIITFLVFIISACNDSEDGFSSHPSKDPTIPTIQLQPFSSSMKKGDTQTIDVSQYVDAPSGESWELSTVTDPKGLTNISDITNKTLKIKAELTGITELTYVITSNGEQYSSIILLSITDNSGNQNSPPTASVIRESTLSQTNIDFDLTASINDPDGDPLTIDNLTQQANRFTLTGTHVDYKPNGFVGVDVAFYGVSDGNGGMAIGEIYVTVSDENPTLPNNPPVANDAAYTLDQGQSIDIDITSLVSDADKDSITLTELLATSGRAKISTSTPNTITYDSGSFYGEDSFVYAITDGNGGYAQAEITLTVNKITIPQPPSPLTASPLTFSMMVGETKTFNVSSGVNSGLPWQLDSVTDKTGLISVDTVNKKEVTVTALSSGIAELTYTVSTSKETQSSELLIAINEANNTPPTAQAVTETTDSVTPIDIDLTNKISDAEGDTLTITSIHQADIRFALKGKKITYTPNGFVGVDHATYTVSDDKGGQAISDIVVNVSDANPSTPNNPPTAKKHAANTNSVSPISLDLESLNLISDADNDPLTLTVYGGEGRAVVNNLTIDYDPAGFVGVDEIVYQVEDGQGGNAVETITITVSDANPVNTPPTANKHTLTLSLQEVNQSPEQLIDVSTLVDDKDQDTVALIDVYGAINTAVVDGPLSIKYTASTSIERDQFIYVVSDGKGGYAQNTITVKVVNSAPTANAISESIDPFDTTTPALTIDLSAHINDSDSDALTLKDIGTATSPATLTNNGLILTYTPNRFEGIESIPYTVSDGQKSASNVISIISASQGSVNANDITLTNMDMDATAQTVDVSSEVSNSTGRQLVIEQVYGATLGTTSVTSNSLSFTYTPNNVSYGVDTFYYIVTDNEGHYAQASVSVTINEPAEPVITSLDLIINGGKAITTLTCDHCDHPTRTEYQYEVTGVPVGTSAPEYTLTGNDANENIGVIVTVKNEYCTADNNGVNGGNACKFKNGKTVVNTTGGVKTIYPASRSFAALKNDDSVVTWGDSGYGGDSSSVESQLTDIRVIYSNPYAFAALKNDNSAVITWGHPTYGGDSSSVETQLTDVSSIHSSKYTFAALKNDGSVVTWGTAWNGNGSDPWVPAPQPLTEVNTIYSFDTAFVALKNDGSVVTWGNVSYGGDSSSVQAQLTNVSTVYSTGVAIAALKNDGSVVTWGYADGGGDSSSVQTQLTDVSVIYSNGYAFAALKNDGSVVTWGRSVYGGDSSSVQTQLTDVSVIYSTGFAFAALKNDGSVVTWGNVSYGGDSSSVQAQLTNVSTVYSTGTAFAALKNDGSVVTWGDRAVGGDSSSVHTQLTDVSVIYSTGTAFAALKNDGSVVTWGIETMAVTAHRYIHNSLTSVLSIQQELHLQP